MKKFLFTLATLIAAGFAANATAPVLAFETQEIELGTGETQEIGITVATMGDDIVRGFQFQLAVFDSKHELINEAVIIKKAYSRNRLWFDPTAFASYNTGNSLDQSNPLTDCYRFLGSNGTFNETLYPEDAQGMQLTKFTVEVPGEWNDEFATIEVYETEDYVNKWSCVNGAFVVVPGSEEAAGLTLKINNKNYNPGTTTTPLTGTVVIGDNDGYEVPVTVDVNGTYDLVVTVAKDGGEAVEVPVTDGKIVLGQTPDYGTYVINATATGNGDYEGTVTAEEKTIVIDQLKKDDPTITFTTAEDGTVTINVVGATRYEVKVDGEAYDGMEVAPIYDATQTIVVEAWNEEQGYIAGYATATTTVAEKAYAPAVNPVITFELGETGVTINVEDYTSYEVIVNGENMGQINFVEQTWEVQHIVVNAVNEPAHQLKGETTDEYELAAKANMDLEGTITIGAVDQETGKVYVSYEGDEEVILTATVDGNPALIENGYIQLPDYGVYTIVVTASATAEHYNDLVSEPAVREWVEPGTADTPTIDFELGETGVTIVVNNYTSYEVIVDGENMGQINFVEKTWEAQHIVVNATNAPQGMYAADNSAEYDLVAKDNMTLEGTVTFGAVEADGRVYVQYTGTEDVTVAVAVDAARAITTLDGKEGYVQLPTYGTYNLTATVTANHYDDLVVGPVQRVWEAPAYDTPAPGVTTQETEDAYIITATGEGTVTLNVTVYDNNGVAHTETVTGQGTVTYTVDKTDYIQYVDYSAYAQRDADANISPATSDSFIEVPAVVPAVEKTASPSIVAQNFYKSHHGKIYNAYQVTVTETEANSELQYRVQKDNGTWSDWMSYEDVLVYVETGEYRVEARAKVAEKDWSDPVDVHFFVSEATSIEELFAGKDIANVRYFNVAGQEMQEINGVTIVVTTFTDGTNATVKVMK